MTTNTLKETLVEVLADTQNTLVLEQIPQGTSTWAFVALPVVLGVVTVVVFFACAALIKGNYIGVFVAATVVLSTLIFVGFINMTDGHEKNRAEAVKTQLQQQTASQVTELQWGNSNKVAVLTTDTGNEVILCSLQPVNSTVVAKCDRPLPAR